MTILVTNFDSTIHLKIFNAQEILSNEDNNEIYIDGYYDARHSMQKNLDISLNDAPICHAHRVTLDKSFVRKIEIV